MVVTNVVNLFLFVMRQSLSALLTEAVTPCFITVLAAGFKQGLLENLLEQGSPTFLKMKAISWYRFMRRATSLVHTLPK